MLTSKNKIFNESLFSNSDTTIGFLALKRVWEWSQIRISSPSCPCMQNEAHFNYQFHSLSWKMWLFTNNFKHRQIIHCWKYFSPRVWIWDRNLKIRLRLAQIHLQSFHFCTKICANDPDTFIRNRKYHLEEGVEMSGLAPITGVESGQRMVFKRHPTVAFSHVATVVNGSASRETELIPTTSVPSGFITLTRACWWATSCSYRGLLPLKIEIRREREGRDERVREIGRRRVREREGDGTKRKRESVSRGKNGKGGEHQGHERREKKREREGVG